LTVQAACWEQLECGGSLTHHLFKVRNCRREAFALIHNAMSREDVAGLARVVLSSRERPMLVAPMGNGLCGVTLRFVHEVRGQEEYFGGIPEMKLPAEMVKLAQHIIKTKTAEFDPAMLEDHYRNALVRVLRKKRRRCPRRRRRSRPRAKTSST
jgi:DNA end-binding protein Ku